MNQFLFVRFQDLTAQAIMQPPGGNGQVVFTSPTTGFLTADGRLTYGGNGAHLNYQVASSGPRGMQIYDAASQGTDGSGTPDTYLSVINGSVYIDNLNNVGGPHYSAELFFNSFGSNWIAFYQNSGFATSILMLGRAPTFNTPPFTNCTTWDVDNLRFGINTEAPTAVLDIRNTVLAAVPFVSINGNVAADQDGNYNLLQINQLSSQTIGGGLARSVQYNAWGNTANFKMARSGGTTIGSYTALGLNNNLGDISFLGTDGTAFRYAADIIATVDGAISANNVPTRLTLSTAGAATGGTVEGWRLDSVQRVTMNQLGTGNLIGDQFEIHGDISGTHGNANFSQVGWGTNAHLKLFRSGGTTIGTHGAANGGGAEVDFFIDDGVQFQQTAFIFSGHDGTVSTNVAPGNLRFATSMQGAASNLLEGLRLDSNGVITTGGVQATQFTNHSTSVEFYNCPGNAIVGGGGNAGVGGTNVGIMGWGGNGHLYFFRSGNQAGNAVVGTPFPNAQAQGMNGITFWGSDGVNFNVASSTACNYDNGFQVTAAASWTTSSTTITLNAANSGTVVPGSLVIDLSLAAGPTKIGTVSTCNGTSLVLTAAALSASQGSSDLLQIVPANSMFGKYTIGTATTPNSGQPGQAPVSASASFTTASTTISLASALPTWAVTGTFVYDQTANHAVGLVSSGAGTTTLTLQAASQINSSGAADSLFFVAPNSVQSTAFAVDSNGNAIFGISAGGTSQTGCIFEINNLNANSHFHHIVWGNGNPRIRGMRSAGTTVGAQVALTAGMNMVQFQGQGSDGTAFGTTSGNSSCSIAFTADANFSTGVIPGRMTFSTTPSTAFSGTIEALRIDSVQLVGASSPTGGLGYYPGLGVGSTVTQGTSRTTGVTLNFLSGAITLFTVAPTAGTTSTFTVTNSTVKATDNVVVNVKSSNAANVYTAAVSQTAAGSFNITVTNVSGSTSDAPVISFMVLRGTIT